MDFFCLIQIDLSNVSIIIIIKLVLNALTAP